MEYPYIPYARHLGISFLQDISSSINILALFKQLLRAKALPLYKPLVVSK